MIHLTASNFEIEARDSDLPVVVMFYAVWCGKCEMMKPVVEQMEKKYAGRIKFCETEIGESEDLAGKYGADIVPTFVMFKGREIESIMQGVLEKNVFEERVRELL